MLKSRAKLQRMMSVNLQIIYILLFLHISACKSHDSSYFLTCDAPMKGTAWTRTTLGCWMDVDSADSRRVSARLARLQS